MVSIEHVVLFVVGFVAWTVVLWEARDWHAGRGERTRLMRFLETAIASEALNAARASGEARQTHLAKAGAYGAALEYMKRSRYGRAREDDHA